MAYKSSIFQSDCEDNYLLPKNYNTHAIFLNFGTPNCIYKLYLGNMADNYLEKKMEEFRSMPQSGASARSSHKTSATLSKLVARNINFKSFNNKIIVRQQHLKDLISFSQNRQSNIPISFYPIIEQDKTARLQNLLKKAAPEWLDYSTPQDLPQAFIIIGYSREESKENNKGTDLTDTFINVGITLNQIMLRAVEMGLNASYTTDINTSELAAEFNISFQPTVIVAIGKGK